MKKSEKLNVYIIVHTLQMKNKYLDIGNQKILLVLPTKLYYYILYTNSDSKHKLFRLSNFNTN